MQHSTPRLSENARKKYEYFSEQHSKTLILLKVFYSINKSLIFRLCPNVTRFLKNCFILENWTLYFLISRKSCTQFICLLRCKFYLIVPRDVKWEILFKRQYKLKLHSSEWKWLKSAKDKFDNIIIIRKQGLRICVCPPS